MKQQKKIRNYEKELAGQALERGLDKDVNKASLEKNLRQIADTVKREGLQ